jgi:hypothetical protein
MHHSAGRASLHNEISERGGAGHHPGGKPQMEGHGGGKDVSHMDIAAVVKKHGPATAIHSSHDHDGDAHHVTTHHGEHMHHSKHASAEDAHAHMGAALGMETPESKGEEQSMPEEMASNEQSEGGVPGIAE